MTRPDKPTFHKELPMPMTLEIVRQMRELQAVMVDQMGAVSEWMGHWPRGPLSYVTPRDEFVVQAQFVNGEASWWRAFTFANEGAARLAAAVLKGKAMAGEYPALRRAELVSMTGSPRKSKHQLIFCLNMLRKP